MSKAIRKVGGDAAGPDGCLKSGQIYKVPAEVSESFAEALVAGYYAEWIDLPRAAAPVIEPAVEVATEPPRESADAAPRRKRRG